MEKRLLLAMVLSVAVIIGFQYFYSSYYGQTPATTKAATVAATPDNAKKEIAGETKETKLAEDKTSAVKAPAAVKKTTLKGEDFTIDAGEEKSVTFDTKGGVLKGWLLKKYSENGKDVNVIWQDERNPFQGKLSIPSEKFDDEIIYKKSVKELAPGMFEVVFKGEAKGLFEITKTYTIKEGFNAEL